MGSAEQVAPGPRVPAEMEVPASTAWPLALACGFALMFAGLLTSVSFTLLGVVLTVAGSVGWFREVFPQEHEVTVPVIAEARVVTERHIVDRVPVAPQLVRAWLPVETYPMSAGIKGGWAGSVAMAVIACTYGLLKTGSIWYPINLLAATVYAQSLEVDPAHLYSFHWSGFGMALLLHAVGSTLVGLLYGAMLPMFARRPIILGGLVAPVLWSAFLYTILDLLNPLLEKRIDWLWFTASQIAFGIVAGLVVMRYSPRTTQENVPLALRAGIEAPGMVRSRGSGEKLP